jgi:hypothetical protein
VLALMGVLCIITTLAIFAFRAYISTLSIGPYLAGTLNAVAITVLNTLFRSLALGLNEWENHRRASSFTQALVYKMFIFQFINCYFSLFYIAFVKPYRTRGIFGEQQECIGALRVDEAQSREQRCYDELQTQLMMIFITNLLVGTLSERFSSKTAAFSEWAADWCAQPMPAQPRLPAAARAPPSPCAPLPAVPLRRQSLPPSPRADCEALPSYPCARIRLNAGTSRTSTGETSRRPSATAPATATPRCAQMQCESGCAPPPSGGRPRVRGLRMNQRRRTGARGASGCPRLRRRSKRRESGRRNSRRRRLPRRRHGARRRPKRRPQSGTGGARADARARSSRSRHVASPA